MDKTVSISLGGFSFIIDENAYSKLNTYLQDVRNSLRGTEGIEDIIEDVEIRISELFRERNKYKEVISNDDVDFVIATMGHPNQYKVEEDEFESENTTSNSAYNNSTYGPQNQRRLFRDPDDKIITGLSAGLAHYLGLDPWAVRATWLVLGILGIFTAGVSFLLVVFCYFILLIFVPKAQSTSEKLQMYGKPANIDTIKKNVEQAGEAVVSGGREISNKLGGAFGVFGKMLLWFIGFLILCIGIGLIIGGFALFFTTWTEMPTELFGYLVEEEWMSITSKILGGLLLVIPGILFTVLGVRCFTNFKASKSLIFGSIAVWFVALFAIIGISLSTASKFRNSVETTKEQTMNIASDTLVVNFKEHSAKNYKYKTFNDIDQLIDEEGNLIIPIRDEFDIKESFDNSFRIEVKYSSKGGSNVEAKRNLESIVYNYEINGNELNLDEFIKIPKNGKFRNQTVDITLFVPANKYVHVRKAESVHVYSGGNYDSEEYYYDIHNKLYLNNGRNIVCLNCENEDSHDHENYDTYNNDGSVNIKINDGTDSAKVIIDQNGIRVKGKDGSVGINVDSNSKSKNRNNQINYKDDTDSININYRNN
ncbi:PspC domain-containing protein [Faecalibacter bovis]|uniref:PspC domain-containing protein n=1 Tax=Faecalibacter bovis TaxID=2898187 RepID=A0ABX7XAQ3_9FLAO|nr:PspC domain-containing protein [Faecalibacter bovis]MBS7331965.1 PspC domain-containing protein [Weeksellaceae bacterium]QTV04972.1 PspC domain-containing protein [Faecalibacter bovis]